ncbi:MAG: class I SAM-dependent methyltransferase [Clostridia bacterium]|nr:class I SAM-dependent methyltransferase [Clostridia bacterium]
MYTNFAYIYDTLMYDIDYSKWADYIEEIFAINNVSPKLLLDLGCGTGNLTLEMAKRGHESIGIDISPDMLSCAKSKALEQGLDILYLNQDMTDFELYGTVDAIVCLMDSVNYVTNPRDLKKMFKLVHNYLNPGGIFIFDINSPFKLEHVLGNNVFYDISEDASYIWKNYYNSRKKLCEFDLTFFVKEEEYYKKYDEIHYERAYSKQELKNIIKDSGLYLSGIYDELKLSKPHSKSKRIFFVCKKQA